MASYNKSYDSGYTSQVQQALKSLGANLGGAGVDGKWGSYTDKAYNQYKNQVDSILSGSNKNTNTGGTWTGFYEDSKLNNGGYNNGNYNYNINNGYTISGQVPNYSVPQLDYQTRSLDDLLSEASGLIGGQYDAQILAAKQGYEASQKSLAKSYENARNTTQDSAVSRGMGRSSYLTDAVANVGLQETEANNQLTSNYNDTVSGLQSSKSSAISSYVQSLQRQQEELMYNYALQQAQLQYQYDALNQGAQMTAYQNALAKASSGGGRSPSNSTSQALNDYLGNPGTDSTKSYLAAKPGQVTGYGPTITQPYGGSSSTLRGKKVLLNQTV